MAPRTSTARFVTANPGRIAAWLRLAAAPTFAAMASLVAAGGAPTAICGPEPGSLAAGGMVWMYLLMSLFHLPPWLAGVRRRPVPLAETATPIEGD